MHEMVEPNLQNNAVMDSEWSFKVYLFAFGSRYAAL
jgi:hypothetical protein